MTIGLRLVLSSHFEKLFRPDPLPFTNQHLVFHDVQIDRLDRSVGLLSTLFRLLEIEKQIWLQELTDQKNHGDDFPRVRLVFQSLKLDHFARFFHILKAKWWLQKSLFM